LSVKNGRTAGHPALRGGPEGQYGRKIKGVPEREKQPGFSRKMYEICLHFASFRSERASGWRGKEVLGVFTIGEDGIFQQIELTGADAPIPPGCDKCRRPRRGAPAADHCG